MITYTPQIGWKGKVPLESSTEIIAPNKRTAALISKYIGIKYIHLSHVEGEVSAKGQKLPHNQFYWMGIYNLIKN